MKHTVIAFFLLASSFSVTEAQQNQSAGTSLTIYNSDFAVARTTVDLDLKQGTNEVTTTKVTSQLEPDSVVLRDPSSHHSVQVVEQNYDAALASQAWMLQKYEGRTIDFQVVHGDRVETVQGRILRAPIPEQGENGAALIEVSGRMQFELPGLPLFPASTDGLLLKPTLRWQIFSNEAAKFPAELSYLTHGFNWNATYNIIAPEGAASSGEELMDLVGWVTISNNSGTEFTDARVKLMAGDVNKVQPMMKAYDRVQSFAMGAVAAPPPVTQKAFDDFHLYDLNRQVTLKDRETKQIEFLRVTGIPVMRKYVYDGAENLPFGYPEDGAYTQQNFGIANTKQVRVDQTFVNSKKNHLGMPLPAGTLRFYRRDTDGQMEFVGESTISHTPEDEKVSVSTGKAFDVTGERTRTNFKVDSSGRSIDESYSIVIKNAKDKPVDVEVVEHLFRAANWDIVEKSTSFNKRNSAMVEFPVTVAAHGQQSITYTVHYSW